MEEFIQTQPKSNKTNIVLLSQDFNNVAFSTVSTSTHTPPTVQQNRTDLNNHPYPDNTYVNNMAIPTHYIQYAQ
eukprot:2465077-Ditylum_brightwellii.AAC.1